jgi:hypothetical protein
MFTCVIDTNGLVSCRDLKDLNKKDWAPITQDDEIHIIIPHTVNREIDKLKEDGRARRRAERARAANTLLKELSTTGVPKIMRATNPEIRISLAPLFNKRHPEIAEFDLDSEDSRIVAETKILLHDNPDLSISLITHDGGMFQLAKVYGVPVYDIPTTWLLGPEPDEPARRVQDLERRLKRYENQEPILEFSVAFETAVRNEPPLIKQVLYGPLSSEQTDQLIATARDIHPLKVSFEEPSAFERSFNPLSRWIPPSSSEIERYQQTDYPAWIEQLGSTLQILHVRLDRPSIPITIFLKNTGSRPASSLTVRFQLFEGAHFLPPDAKPSERLVNLKLPTPPDAPSGRWESPFFNPRNLVTDLTSFNFEGPSTADHLAKISAGRRSDQFYWIGGRPTVASATWSFECEDFRHQEESEPFAALVDIPRELQRKEFSLECVASAANLTEPKKQYFRFQIEPITQDLFDQLKEVIDRVGTWIADPPGNETSR